MKKIENEIGEILNKFPKARIFYRKYINASDEEMLKILKDWVEADKIRNENKIIENIFDDYYDLLGLSPSEVLERVKYKNVNEIRMDFEELKREVGVSGKRQVGKKIKMPDFNSGKPQGDFGMSDFGHNNFKI